jgi:hypothetical protein
VEPVIFKRSYINIPLSLSGEAAVNPIAGAASSADIPDINSHTKFARTTSAIDPTAPSPSMQPADGSRYLPLLEEVETAIRNRNYESVRHCFTAEGYAVFTQLVKYGNGVILSKPAYTFMPFEDGLLVRSLPMRFNFSNNRRTFVEEVVFNISRREGKIRSLSFALPGNVCRDILSFDKWNEYSRLAIINFIENYQTAYALKRLDYIESIFSDNALIIVGKVLKNYTGADNSRLALNPNQARLTQYSKNQYIKQLNVVFKSNEYVNLKFTDISVKKAGTGGEIYGIQLKQDYFSTTYGDTGYLFLMVDLNKTDEPVIHIRTWQPEKDPDFGLYDISNF